MVNNSRKLTEKNPQKKTPKNCSCKHHNPSVLNQ